MSQKSQQDIPQNATDVSEVSRDLAIVALAAAVVSTQISSRTALAVSAAVLMIAGFVLAYRIKLLALSSV